MFRLGGCTDLGFSCFHPLILSVFKVAASEVSLWFWKRKGVEEEGELCGFAALLRSSLFLGVLFVASDHLKVERDSLSRSSPSKFGLMVCRKEQSF